MKNYLYEEITDMQQWLKNRPYINVTGLEKMLKLKPGKIRLSGKSIISPNIQHEILKLLTTMPPLSQNNEPGITYEPAPAKEILLINGKLADMGTVTLTDEF